MPTAERTKPGAVLDAVLGAELRIRCLIALTERSASPTELARDFGADKGTVAYHVKKLREAGMVEEVDSRPARGSTERFYRAVERPLIDGEQSAAMPKAKRERWTELIAALIWADLTTSMRTGIFSERPDHTIIRFPTHVDEQGWEELREVYEDAHQAAMDIEARSAGRAVNAENGGTFAVRVVSAVFEMP